ncbi:hypothetical protein CR194_01420 [Salipaludibacillus keqinensis]|uniref:Helix-hairpin-helix DNA-binding motif class 1 domain-containing protein n=1 Tax=Salipaludibacillus keqinensis TaxID=2045207 RepID=A0A323TXA6_9BACI|nr:helix-hairpin-helix domain-containing protein [Salipaludibacillus keqinensis]PYZ94225.1 hypothetical protein CR194_01420 [Salipaludibacillus keqinensis]
MQFMKEYVQEKGLFLSIIGGVCLISVIFFWQHTGEVEEADATVLPWENEQLTDRISHEEEKESEIILMVDIKGEVFNPGVYHVMEGERVIDVIEKAGGFNSEANQSAINLAERCFDEMVIFVPSEGDEDAPSGYDVIASGAKHEGILINQADANELTTLPGIGPAKADAIISFREENGPFQTLEDLTNVPGIGEKTLESIRDHLVIRK